MKKPTDVLRYNNKQSDNRDIANFIGKKIIQRAKPKLTKNTALTGKLNRVADVIKVNAKEAFDGKR